MNRLIEMEIRKEMLFKAIDGIQEVIRQMKIDTRELQNIVDDHTDLIDDNESDIRSIKREIEDIEMDGLSEDTVEELIEDKFNDEFTDRIEESLKDIIERMVDAI